MKHGYIAKPLSSGFAVKLQALDPDRSDQFGAEVSEQEQA
jgi:hypothetical protein